MKALKNYFSHLVELDEASWQAALDLSSQSRYQAGESIFLAGDITDQIRFVVQGVACHYYTKPDGNRFNKSFLQCGDVASSLSSLQQKMPARFGCDALTDVHCLNLPYAKLPTLAEEYPIWRQIRELLITRLALRKEAREADLLLLSPTERYQQFVSEWPELNQNLPNYHIASYLGISEVSLSRIRARLGIQHAYQKQQ